MNLYIWLVITLSAVEMCGKLYELACVPIKRTPCGRAIDVVICVVLIVWGCVLVLR